MFFGFDIHVPCKHIDLDVLYNLDIMEYMREYDGDINGFQFGTVVLEHGLKGMRTPQTKPGRFRSVENLNSIRGMKTGPITGIIGQMYTLI